MNQKSTNITWHDGEVTQADREDLLRQKGSVLWFTGLSGAGKSTIAVALEKALTRRGKLCYRLDGDNVRHGLNKNLGFSPEDRTENIRRIGEVAKLFADCGVIVTTSFISPYRADRDLARRMIPEGRFIEVAIRCSLEICEQRDPKGLYKKARSGQIAEFTGISAPYEEPEHPELIIDTATCGVEDAVRTILAELELRQLI